MVAGGGGRVWLLGGGVHGIRRDTVNEAGGTHPTGMHSCYAQCYPVQICTSVILTFFRHILYIEV